MKECTSAPHWAWIYLIMQGILTAFHQCLGELLNKTDKQRRLDEQARNKIMDFYMMEHSSGIIIDARLKGNFARLINSSCDPNCETQKWRDAATEEASLLIIWLPRDPLSHEMKLSCQTETSCVSVQYSWQSEKILRQKAVTAWMLLIEINSAGFNLSICALVAKSLHLKASYFSCVKYYSGQW